LKYIFKNLIYCGKLKGEIYHITGDVYYLMLLLPRKRTVMTIHDMVSVERNKGLKKHIIKWLWYGIPTKRCEKITVISKQTRNELLKYYPNIAERIVEIPNPVDPEFSYTEYQFNEIEPTILQIGTRENKNLEKVIEALHGIKCKLRIIGSLSDLQKNLLKKNDIKYENVCNVSDEQMIIEYRNSDLVLFVSTYEGFGMPIIEAQASGRPVVTSNLLPMNEVAGDKACLVNPYDSNSIREGVEKVIINKEYREQLIKDGKVNAERYSVDRITKMYLEVYEMMQK